MPPGSFHVVLLGDATRVRVLAELAARAPDDVAFSTPPVSSSIMDAADEAANADFALIIADATQGPTPVVREHIQLARQLRMPTLGLFLSNTDELLEVMEGDRDLHELVELELRELLLTYELPGDSAPRYYDSDNFDPSSGPAAFVGALVDGSFPSRAPRTSATVSGSILDSEIYLLSELEGGAAGGIASGSNVSIWLEGQRATGKAELAAPIRPGEASGLRIRFASELTSTPSARFLIERNGRLTGMGVVVALE